MRFVVKPCGGETPQVSPEDPEPDYLRDAVTNSMRGSESIHFDFMIQVRNAGEEDLHIEDATKHWDAVEFPFVSVARIVIPVPQEDITSGEAEAECEKLVFTPWHSMAAHQPLGSINRLRKAVYLVSKDHRGLIQRARRLVESSHCAEFRRPAGESDLLFGVGGWWQPRNPNGSLANALNLVDRNCGVLVHEGRRMAQSRSRNGRVHMAEDTTVYPRDQALARERQLLNPSGTNDLTAICLSGGGIRSASSRREGV